MCCKTGLSILGDNSVDAIVTDPPYELGFMGKAWDSTGIANDPAVWAEALRVLKPGGHLLAFSGSRTYHRMTCAIEDGGFEIRDQIMWIYGSGMPKAPGVLKPSHEPIAVARKPFPGSAKANFSKHGVGLLFTEACRIEAECETGWGGGGSKLFEGGLSRDDGEARPVQGRWAANIIHDGSEEVLAGFPETGKSRRKTDALALPYEANNKNTVFGPGMETAPHAGFDDISGSAARFFYCAKATSGDRDEGLEGFDTRAAGGLSGRADGSLGSVTMRKNIHPTVKPTDLMRYLVRLVTPPGGLVVDLFAGSGNTGKAAKLEGFQFLGFELSEEYAAIANARIEAA